MSVRTVVVTGGSSGIGAAVAAALAHDGDKVIVVDRQEPSGGRDFIHCDLSDRNSILHAISRLPSRIDVLVNSAGVSGLLPVPVVMAVNFYGLRAFTEGVVERMSKGGSVINVASTSGWFWREHLDDVSEIVSASTDEEIADVTDRLIPNGHDAYARSKEAVVVWTATAAQKHLGLIRFNSVSPGPIETPLLADFYEAMGHAELDPLTARSGGRNGTPEEVASVVRFLASPYAFWVNGTDIPVDHGAEMAEFLAGRGVIPHLENA